MELNYIVVLVAHYHFLCLWREYVCPCLTLPTSLFIAHICLSLSHAVALLVCRTDMSVLVPHYRPPCLSHGYVCPCRTLFLSLSIAQIRLPLSHAVALLVYRTDTSVLIARCCSPCLMTLDKESTSVREGQPSIY